MKPFGYVIFIAIFSLAPLLFLFKYLPNLDKDKTSEKLEGLGVGEKNFEHAAAQRLKIGRLFLNC